MASAAAAAMPVRHHANSVRSWANWVGRGAAPNGGSGSDGSSPDMVALI